MNKTVLIRTFGCQMNVRDSEVICGLLTTKNYRLTTNPDDADVIILNTCSVRQHAEDKVWSEIGRYKKKGPSLRLRTNHAAKKIIGVIGCMAQNYKDEIFRRAPQVDFVAGPSDIAKIPEILKRLSVSKKGGTDPFGVSPLFLRKIWETDGSIRPEEIYHTGFYEDREHAYVVISEGCSNFCSYCVVPYVRGALRNRNYQGILREIEEAVAKGITKITLLGQNVNAYESIVHNVHQSTVSFVRLLEMVNNIKGLKEFSFVTSHPRDTSIQLFEAMRDCQKLKKYLHLPVQSGSDKILKLMNRGYTRKFYLDLIDKYRKIVKGAVLTSDIIVGFPTESEEDFKASYDLVKEAEFGAAYIFKYSPRPNTEAAKMPDDVTKSEKERRHGLILGLQKKSPKIKMKNKKIRLWILVCSFGVCLPAACLPDRQGQAGSLPACRTGREFGVAHKVYAATLESIKSDFLSSNYQEVINAGEKMLSGYGRVSHSDELCYLVGLSYLKTGSYIRAIQMFEKILSESKTNKTKEGALLGRGDAYFLQGDYERAKIYYNDLLNSYPRTELLPGAYYRLSQVESKIGGLKEAQAYSEKLKSEFPLSPEARNYNQVCISADFYTVQVGSFLNPDNANNLLQELVRKGYAAYIEESQNEGRAAYRVKVGKLNNRQEAVDLKNKLSQEGYPTNLCP